MDLKTFSGKLYQWANALTTNSNNLPLALPLRLDGVDGGFRVGAFLTSSFRMQRVSRPAAVVSAMVRKGRRAAASGEHAIPTPCLWPPLCSCCRWGSVAVCAVFMHGGPREALYSRRMVTICGLLYEPGWELGITVCLGTLNRCAAFDRMLRRCRTQMQLLRMRDPDNQPTSVADITVTVEEETAVSHPVFFKRRRGGGGG